MRQKRKPIPREKEKTMSIRSIAPGKLFLLIVVPSVCLRWPFYPHYSFQQIFYLVFLFYQFFFHVSFSCFFPCFYFTELLGSSWSANFLAFNALAKAAAEKQGNQARNSTRTSYLERDFFNFLFNSCYKVSGNRIHLEEAIPDQEDLKAVQREREKSPSSLLLFKSWKKESNNLTLEFQMKMYQGK